MRPFILAALSVALLSARPLMAQGARDYSHASDDVQIRTHIRHYEITGTTAASLWRSVQANSPEESRGQFAAFTDVDLFWSYRYAPAGNTCAVRQAEVGVGIEIHLPRWTTPPDTDPALVGRWRAFAEALKEHEEGHEWLATELAHAVYRELLAVRTASCRSIEVAARAAVERAQQEYSRRVEAYDRRTDHGRTQGAYWTW